MLKPLLLLIFAPPSPDGGTGRRARLKIWLSQGSAGSIPVLGTKGQSECGFECVGAKYPRTQTQTHSVFLGVSLSTNALLWPFLQMLQRRTGSLTESFSQKTC